MTMLRLLAPLFAGVCALGDFTPVTITIDLDKDPEHRWDHTMTRSNVVAWRNLYNATLNSTKLAPFVSRAKRLLGNPLVAKRLLPGDQYLETKGIAKGIGMELADLVMFNSFYDVVAAKNGPLAFPACTSVLVQNLHGQIIHGRNLDFFFSDALRKSVIRVDWKRNRTVLFTSINLGPAIGFNTAIRWGGWTVSHDERDKGSILENFWDMLVRGRPVVFSQVREAMERFDNYRDALRFFSTEKFDAPSYFVLGGTRAGEGAIITRNRDSVADVWALDASAGRWFTVVTNYDRTEPDPSGDDRRHPAERALEATGQAHIDPDSLWEVLSLSHVNRTAGEREPYNSDTIYTSVMQASDRSAFKTLVREFWPPALANNVVIV